jgi:hypothetical protein
MKKRHTRKLRPDFLSEKDRSILQRFFFDQVSTTMNYFKIDVGDGVAGILKRIADKGAGAEPPMPELILTNPTRRLLDKGELVVRLLRMPGDQNIYKLAKLLVAENRSPNMDSAKRQIDDALAAIRRVQAESRYFLLSIGTQPDPDLKFSGLQSKGGMTLSKKTPLENQILTKYGVRYIP